MANSLKRALPLIIGPFQGPFVAGRKILDEVLIANELIDSRQWLRNEGWFFKIDLEKAYDHVEWDFVVYMLHIFGFGEKWRGWFRECISTTSFSILVNDSPTKLFKASRGIRQGDPLSPFMFTIMVEALSSFLVRTRELGLLSSFLVRARESLVWLASLRWVVAAKWSPIYNLQMIPFFSVRVGGKKFCLWRGSWDASNWFLGLKVNISKIMLVGIGCSSQVANQYTKDP